MTGWRNPLTRIALAWGALLTSGLSLALTGELDWYGLYGERAVFAAALGAAGVALWYLGERSDLERHTCWGTLAAMVLALALFPFASRVEFYSGVWLIHVGLCAQLFAWAAVARKAQRTGLVIMLGGMLIETLGILPAAQFDEVDTACVAGMRLTCMAGPYVAMALPGGVTAALIVLWLTPIETAVRDRLWRS